MRPDRVVVFAARIAVFALILGSSSFFFLAAAKPAAGAAITRIPVRAIDQEPNPNQHEIPIRPVNGKVVNISKTDLTLEVVAEGKSDPIDFIIDENTKTDGDIKPGSWLPSITRPRTTKSTQRTSCPPKQRSRNRRILIRFPRAEPNC